MTVAAKLKVHAHMAKIKKTACDFLPLEGSQSERMQGADSTKALWDHKWMYTNPANVCPVSSTKY